MWILSRSIFMIKICCMQGFACIETLSIQEVWRVQKILKRCSRYYYKQKKPLQHSSNSWRASHQDEKQLTHKPIFYVFKVEVKILFERKLHLLCSSAYNSSTCTVAYETYLQHWIWLHKFTSYGMKGANNTHILEERTYEVLIFMSEMISCLNSCLKSSNDRCFHSAFNSCQYPSFSTNVLEKGIL